MARYGFAIAVLASAVVLSAPVEVSLWVDPAGRLRPSARDALALIGAAGDEGLDSADYDERELHRLAARIDAARHPDPSDATGFDATLTAAVVRYLRDLHLGRVDPRAIGFRLNAPVERHDFDAELRQALADGRLREKAASLRPPLAQYRLLRDALARYRALAGDADVTKPLPATVVVHPGDRCDWAVPLRRRLVALGDLSASAPELPDAGRYEGPLVDGVRRFQVRHGLQPDGVLGRATMAALQVPVSRRVRQIELALERLRWLPHLGDERLLVVNIPMFRLWAWDAVPPTGEPLFSMGVIVGRALGTQTPVFVESMREVILRPYWNVPRSILRQEILPTLTLDPDYLRRQQMEIVDGPGDDAQVVETTAAAIDGLRQGALRLRQRPGPQNALGLIKFVFPNDENVYMHGTPAQTLFARSRRDFSHGCVRVEDPLRLAEWVLRDRPAWDRDRIHAATAGSASVHVKLSRPIRVILFYTTVAVMPEDGSVWFADDIYGHDGRLDRALAWGEGDR